MTATDNQLKIEWDYRLRKYTMDVVLDSGREQLVFDNLTAAFKYRKQYEADIELLKMGEQPRFNSGATL